MTVTIIFIISLLIYLIVGGAILRILYVEDKKEEDYVFEIFISALWPLVLIAAPFIIIGYIGYWATKKLYK